jgi:hypothetical protein
VERREELDDALATAVEHTEQAERALLDEPAGSPRAEALAEDVVHRAEDVDVLAAEARDMAESEDPGR